MAIQLPFYKAYNHEVHMQHEAFPLQWIKYGDRHLVTWPEVNMHN